MSFLERVRQRCEARHVFFWSPSRGCGWLFSESEPLVSCYSRGCLQSHPRRPRKGIVRDIFGGCSIMSNPMIIHDELTFCCWKPRIHRSGPAMYSPNLFVLPRVALCVSCVLRVLLVYLVLYAACCCSMPFLVNFICAAGATLCLHVYTVSRRSQRATPYLDKYCHFRQSLYRQSLALMF